MTASLGRVDSPLSIANIDECGRDREEADLESILRDLHQACGLDMRDLCNLGIFWALEPQQQMIWEGHVHKVFSELIGVKSFDRQISEQPPPGLKGSLLTQMTVY